jgi:hypothetical protein
LSFQQPVSWIDQVGPKNVMCAEGQKKRQIDPTGMGFPWALSARGQLGENFGGPGGFRLPGDLPTFKIPTNVPTAKPSAGRTVVAEAAAQDMENKQHLVMWQMENRIHACARNQRDAAESMEGQRWANGRTQTSSGPFGAATIPPTTTATGVPWDSKRKLEPMKKVDAEQLEQLWTLTEVPKWLKFNVFETLRGK